MVSRARVGRTTVVRVGIWDRRLEFGLELGFLGLGFGLWYPCRALLFFYASVSAILGQM